MVLLASRHRVGTIGARPKFDRLRRRQYFISIESWETEVQSETKIEPALLTSSDTPGTHESSAESSEDERPPPLQLMNEERRRPR